MERFKPTASWLCLFLGSMAVTLGGLLWGSGHDFAVCGYVLVTIGACLIANETLNWFRARQHETAEMRQRLGFKMPNHVPGDW